MARIDQPVFSKVLCASVPLLAALSILSCQTVPSTTSAPSSSPAPSASAGTQTGGFPGGPPGTSASSGPAVESGTSAYNPDPLQIESCASASGIAKVVCLADALKAKLNAAQLASLQRSYSLSEAKRWSNLPQGLVRDAGRVGLSFGEMTTEQIQYAKALLVAVTGSGSNEGWEEIQQLLNADEYLQANGGGPSYGAQNYYLAFLGTPAATGTFEIQFGGHHLAFANTYTNGSLAGATPSFRGVEPFGTFNWNQKTNQPLNQEKDTLAAMLTGLSESELASARLSQTFSDLLIGPQKDGTFPATPSGLKIGTLSAEKKALVLAAIRTYVEDVASADAETIMAKYTKELDDTYIAYAGTTAMTNRNDYLRLDGPSLWLEYSCQGGIILQGTHPHLVWRDKTTDYGGND